MIITHKFKLTQEEREHLKFTMRFFREIDCYSNIQERLESDFCSAIADRLNWFLDEFEGEETHIIEAGPEPEWE